MTSSKKQRGKQRKAAKNNAAAGGTRSPHNANLVRMVRRGDNVVTNVLSDSDLLNNEKAVQNITIMVAADYNISRTISLDVNRVLKDVVPVVLDFLKRCEDETFDDVIANAGKRGVGGDLISPVSWVSALLTAVSREPSCRIEIAQNIGPLVRCMCADTKRVFFNSKKHWKKAILPFARLIYNMMTKYKDESEYDKNMIDLLLQHEGLLQTIVQWGFWEDEYRPDITRKLKGEDCTTIIKWGREITKKLLEYASSDTPTPNDKNLLESIACTSIVSKEYDPSCMVSYVAGLMRLVKATGDTKYLVQVENLMRRTDCVDKVVITEIIDCGINHTADYKSASSLARFLFLMVLNETTHTKKGLLSDSRAAFAIRAGLIELCLTFIERFEDIIRTKTALFDRIHNVFKAVYRISLHLKTAKAIGRKRNSIEEELNRLEENAVSSNFKCKKLLGMVRCILDINGAYCCRCNKLLASEEIKRCNGCNCMTYCSKACQKEDWSKGGHSQTCSIKNCTDAARDWSQFQGRFRSATIPESEREAMKLEGLEQNINMIQRKLFLDNAESILSQARSLDIPLCDCVVAFDLGCYPLAVEVKRYTEHFEGEEIKSFEGTRSKENITCSYASDIYNGCLDEHENLQYLEMQKFFPHVLLSQKKHRNNET